MTAALVPAHHAGDDPATVAAAATRAAVAAGLLARWIAAVRACLLAVGPHWRSGDGSAAVRELAALALVGERVRVALTTVAAALRAYERALVRACAGSARPGADAEVQAAAGRAARAVHGATDALGVPGRSGSNGAGTRRALARQLPLWAEETARALAADAAGALTRSPPPGGAEILARMRPYAAWLDDPVFARTLLRRLRVDRLRDLLVRIMPGGDPPAIRSVRHAVYRLLGTVLAAGTRGPGLPPRWLPALVDGVDATALTTPPETWQLRRSLSLVLRYGRYGGAALDVLVPPLLRASGDHGDVVPADNDPVVGALTALAGAPAAAARLLGSDRMLGALFDRTWTADGDRALGAALAAASLVRDGSGVRLVEAAVRVAGCRLRIPAGAAGGLGRLLAGHVEAVNQSLVDRADDLGLGVDEPPPIVGTGPQARFARPDIARALFFALQSTAGAAAVYAGQAGYTAGVLASAGGRATPELSLRTVSRAYGRLSELHLAAASRQAATDNAAFADRLHARMIWIESGSTAAGLLPLPELPRFLSIVLGEGKGYSISRGTQWLLDRFHDRPIAHDLARRLGGARALAAAEERQTKLFVQALRARLLGTGQDAAAMVSAMFQSGQQDAREYLLPAWAVHDEQ